MTPLNQQLEDKKKEIMDIEGNLPESYQCPKCKIYFKTTEEAGFHSRAFEHYGDYNLPIKHLTIGEKERRLNILKAEIAILEQAITEMQKQRQEILDVIDEILFHMKCKNCDCNICQCRKLDFVVDVRVIKEIRAEVDTELNQPKTDK